MRDPKLFKWYSIRAYVRTLQKSPELRIRVAEMPKRRAKTRKRGNEEKESVDVEAEGFNIARKISQTINI